MFFEKGTPIEKYILENQPKYSFMPKAHLDTKPWCSFDALLVLESHLSTNKAYV